MLCSSIIAIGLHLGTYHFDRNRDYQEFNPGTYVRCEDVTAGVYFNSERKTSAWIGVERKTGPIDWTLGVVFGYTRSPVLPLVVPSYKVGSTRVSLLLPLEKGGGGFHVSYEF